MEEHTSLLEKVDESLRLSRENNNLLKAMRRDAVIGFVVKTLIWIVLLALGLYFSMKFLEPYRAVLESIPQQENGSGINYGALFEEYKELLGP